MASIVLDNVTVDFPIYTSTTRSFKNRVIRTAIGGELSEASGVVVVRSLDSVSLDLKSGDRLGIVGHNGAGKTTLLRVMAGVYEPQFGTVRSSGFCSSLINISLGIDPEATGRENILVRGLLMGLSHRKIQALMPGIVDFAELGHFVDLPVRTYSAGMQLRLAFSVATAVRADITLMDEWLSTGDLAFQSRANIRLREMLAASDILVFASHSRALLTANCNRLVWLEHGRVRMQGDVGEVAEAYFAPARPAPS
jgi:lipopolysaccharide transport system ATP-binding protein